MMLRKLTAGSLFAGIGGFDLGLERAGFEIAWQVEIDPYCQRVLAKHWPNVSRYGDIRVIDWGTVPRVDVLCGGFPCQDISLAGKRAGINGGRSGLWSEYVRAVRTIRPKYVCVENVEAVLHSHTFTTVLGDLASCGYDAEWEVIPAAAVGAPHHRARLWLVAYRDGFREQGIFQQAFQRVPAFSWVQNVGGVAGLYNRPDLPEPLLRRISHGFRCRVDRVGNAVVPQIIEQIGVRLIAMEN